MCKRLKSLIEDDLVREGDVLVVFGDGEEDSKVQRVVGVVNQLERPYQVILETVSDDGRTTRRTVPISKTQFISCEVVDNLSDDEWSDFVRFAKFSSIAFKAANLIVEHERGESAPEEEGRQASLFSPASVSE